MDRGEGADCMRRSFCGAVVGVLVGPSIAIAQASKAIRRIGVLAPKLPVSRGAPDRDDLHLLVALLRERGWVEGKNLAIEDRFGKGGFDELHLFAEELVRLDVEIIVTYGTPATFAAKSATTSIPIVMNGVGNPVATGLVASLARPVATSQAFPSSLPRQRSKRPNSCTSYCQRYDASP